MSAHAASTRGSPTRSRAYARFWHEATMSALLERVFEAARPRVQGRVARVLGLNLEIDGLQLPTGAAVRVEAGSGPVVAEVVAVTENGLVCMPLGELRG